MSSVPQVRAATRQDATALLSLIDALADYEKLDPPDAAAKARLVEDLFGPKPRLEAFLVEAAGEPVGYVLVLETYSSFLALPTLYLEDLFVLPSHRGQGVGGLLFRAMAAEAMRRGCGRMDWQVLDWNQLAIGFYERLGGKRLEAWQTYRLTREELEKLAPQP